MAWPSWRDFNDAVQDPRSCFADADLWGEATTDAMGLPKVCSGNFAVVYQMHAADRSQDWAVKCFTRPAADGQRRYREISAHLQRTGLPFTVAFTYQEEGIRVRGSWYPIVKMDWVKGLTLTQFVRGSLDRPGVLEVLSQVWLKLAQRLRHALVTHGDLQHGNVLLVQGSTDKKLALKLVDYDGMWVPALAGKAPSGEVGLPAYQHPQRARDNIYGSKVDRFSQLVIYTALRALRLQGEALWQRFDTGENLLFTARDFAAPGESKLLGELWNGNDGDLRHLAGRLILAALGPLAETPELNDVTGEDSVKLLAHEEQALVKQIMSGEKAAKALPGPVLAEVENGRANTKPSAQDSAAFPLSNAKSGGPRPFAHPGKLSNTRDRKSNRWHWAIAGGVLFAACLLAMVALAVQRSSERLLVEKAKAERRLAEEKAEIARREAEEEKAVADRQRRAEQEEAEVKHKQMEQEKAEIRRKKEDQEKALTARLLVEEEKAEAKRKLEEYNLRKKVYTFRGHTSVVSSVAFSPDGERLASASWDKTVKVWDAQTGREPFTLRGHSEAVLSLAFSPDRKCLASASPDGTVKVWNAQTGREMFPLKGATGDGLSVAFSPDGTRLASAGWYNGVKVWYALNGQQIHSYKHIMGVNSVAFSPDGKRLASASGDNTVTIWDAQTGREAFTLRGHTNGVNSVAFSPDGKHLASASYDNTVKVWDAQTSLVAFTLTGHTNGVLCVAYSPDGKHLASGSRDCNVKVWDAQTRLEAFTLTGHSEWVHSVAFSPDGKRIASGSSDQTVIVWDAQTGQ